MTLGVTSVGVVEDMGRGQQRVALFSRMCLRTDDVKSLYKVDM